MNIPKIRFSEFHNEWKLHNFTEFANISGGYAFPSNKMKNEKSKYQIIKMGNIYQGVLDLNRNPSYYQELNDKEMNYLLKNDDIIITLTGTVNKKDYGYSCILKNPNNLLLNQRLALIRTVNINPYFLYLKLNTNDFLDQFYNSSTGGTGNQTNVSTKTIETFNLLIPDIHEQNKIAKTIELIDKRIDLQVKSIEILELLKKGLIENQLNRDFPLVNLKKILKERKLYSEKGLEYPHVTLSKDGIYDKGDRYNRDFLVKSDDKQYKITKLNDLCYNPANLKFGVICLNEYGSAIFSPIYVTFEINKDVNPKYIKYYTMRNNFINAVRKYEQGTVYERMAVSPEDFLRFDIKLPNRKTQDEIVNKIDLLDNKINLESKLLEELELLKKGLMQNMFV